jgi:mercuric ion binding protein
MNRNILLLFILFFILLGLVSSTWGEDQLKGQSNIIVEIKGMTCRLCSKAIEKSLLQVPGIQEAKATHKSGVAVIIADESVSNEEINEAVKKAGAYTVVDIQRSDMN